MLDVDLVDTVRQNIAVARQLAGDCAELRAGIRSLVVQSMRQRTACKVASMRTIARSRETMCGMIKKE